jgi:hypothetical protein
MKAAGFYPGGFDKLSLEDKKKQLHFQDLQGTAVTLLAAADATIPQIASITGHSLQSVTRILERYLPLTSALSKAAMTVFENAPETGFANQLQSRQV